MAVELLVMHIGGIYYIYKIYNMYYTEIIDREP